jgi:hypothetical protein
MFTRRYVWAYEADAHIVEFVTVETDQQAVGFERELCRGLHLFEQYFFGFLEHERGRFTGEIK